MSRRSGSKRNKKRTFAKDYKGLQTTTDLQLLVRLFDVTTHLVV